ncbi:CDP-diacylglycerol--glycerol-3-phosphate 3-phosphatidyltransferase, mitochondrial [Plutella xylostella]|uniref:CDP-diacylglycerol--glycerol-3-phosphate 3-phosphatidyltransferase, mitochondrial n=1 Tax=Plutella xylostella TaxID=51655 RepID=UPI0020328EB7|nr:CDP-diacylglycerol--glycerol-3-phosphate 3-phosphatidyltransferase, mitochondrial [Plutella xylostella]
MLINSNMKLRIKAAELQHFSWLYKLAPCFPVKATKINVITDPRTFYDTLCERFKNADSRISVASLYIGTGELERRLLDITKDNVVMKKNLKFSVLLDYQRGTRGEVNSKTLLQSFVNDVPERSNISLYQTPRLHGSWSNALPSRYNEIVGLQHMKLYIADDSVLLSGANCSSDYFHQRQDRYIEIHDPDLADFYSELIDVMGSYSKKCVGDAVTDHGLPSKEAVVAGVRDKVSAFTDKWMRQQEAKPINDAADTWVFPLLQMGEYGITQDEEATQAMLSSAPEGSQLKLATGYFNLTEDYTQTLLQRSKAMISLLMAHPNANGFLGASFPAGGIPHAYSLIAKQFWQRVLETGQAGRIQMMEYEREGWTFHAKGLWYYAPGAGLPCATVVGSANLGERSVRRDLEAQAAVLTVDPDLQRRLHSECTSLHTPAASCGASLLARAVPLWVRATVGLFRTYF